MLDENRRRHIDPRQSDGLCDVRTLPGPDSIFGQMQFPGDCSDTLSSVGLVNGRTAALVEDQFTGLEITDDQVDKIEVVTDLIRYIESAGWA
jgi:hypothetical protein